MNIMGTQIVGNFSAAKPLRSALRPMPSLPASSAQSVNGRSFRPSLMAGFDPILPLGWDDPLRTLDANDGFLPIVALAATAVHLANDCGRNWHLSSTYTLVRGSQRRHQDERLSACALYRLVVRYQTRELGVTKEERKYIELICR